MERDKVFVLQTQSCCVKQQLHGAYFIQDKVLIQHIEEVKMKYFQATDLYNWISQKKSTFSILFAECFARVR